MAEPSRPPSTVLRHLPGHAADLVAAASLLVALLVIAMSDHVVTATTVVLLGALALAVRGLAGITASWLLDNW